MSSPVFNRMNRGNGAQRRRGQNGGGGQQGGNDPQFMQFANRLVEFGREFQDDPGQMIADAVNDGRITRKQYAMVESMAKKIQRMLVCLGF